MTELPPDPEATPSAEGAADAPIDDAAGQVPYLFGDLLALARADWIRQMAARLDERGYGDYRASDAVVVRFLRRRGAVTIGEIGTRLGVTRQAARKLVTGLEARGLVAEARDEHDARKVNVTLTEAGRAYTEVVLATVYQLNRALLARLGDAELAAVDTALRVAITNPRIRALAERIPPPTGRRPG